MEQISDGRDSLPMKVIIVKVIANSLMKEKAKTIGIDSLALHLNKQIKMPFNKQ